MRKTELGGWFDRIVCAEEVGEAKEEPIFWQKLEKLLGFDRSRTMLADDTAKVLRSAKTYGPQHLIFVAKPSSRLEVKYSAEFPAIVYFNELIF